MATATLVASPATASAATEYHEFRRQQPGPWSFENGSGFFTGQIDWSVAGAKTLAWRFQVKDSLASQVYGGTMDCSASLLGYDYHDNHLGISPLDVWHSSIPNLNDNGNIVYKFRAVCQYKVLNANGSFADGFAETRLNFRVER